MLIDVVKFGAQCHFPAEAINALQQALVCLEQDCEFAACFSECREELFTREDVTWRVMDVLAEKAGIHPYTIHQLFLIYCAQETYGRYQAAGYTEAFFWDAMKDLKCKMEETHEVYGVWGVYCGWWLIGLILGKCFCLGRLQFEIIPSEFYYELAGHVLKPHEPVVNVHIPSFGRLHYGDVLDAYSRAAKFFAHLFPDGAVWFHCETWILYPQVNALLPEGNMKRFSRDFDVVHACIDPKQDDRYRVFKLPSNVPMETYPANNTLQRNLKAWLLDGNTMGVGFGLFLWKNGEVIPYGA